MNDKPIFAVKIGVRWYIARISTASEYGLEPASAEVWSEDSTTALLCEVGKEAVRICLDLGVRG